MDKQTESLAREKFEKWLRSQPHVLNVGVSESGSYVLREDRIAWSAWKASRESLVVELPRPTCTYADHSYPAFSQKQVEKILVDCGIRIKREGV